MKQRPTSVDQQNGNQDNQARSFEAEHSPHQRGKHLQPGNQDCNGEQQGHKPTTNETTSEKEKSQEIKIKLSDHQLTQQEAKQDPIPGAETAPKRHTGPQKTVKTQQKQASSQKSQPAGDKSTQADNSTDKYLFRAGEIIQNPKKNIVYKAMQLLGEGTFGQVLHVVSLSPNPKDPTKMEKHNMALKVVKKQPAYTNQGLIEIKNLRLVAKYEQQTEGNTRNYLNIYDAFKWQEHLCIAMELLDNSLLNILESSEYKGIEMKWIERWCKQLLLFLMKMHCIGIIHCDIKPENIMFRPEQPDKPLLIDFSSSCLKGDQIFTYIQSRFYRCPEVLLECKPYTEKIDMWSLGCVLAEMYLGLPLFPGASTYDQLAKILALVGASVDRGFVQKWMVGSQVCRKYFTDDCLTVDRQEDSPCSQKQGDILVEQEEARINLILRPASQFRKLTGLPVDSNPSYYKIECLEQLLQIRNPHPRDQQTHELFIDLLKKLLVFEPQRRLSAEEAFLHPFVGGTFAELRQLRAIEEILEQESSQNQ